jgi:hypothetical protein
VGEVSFDYCSEGPSHASAARGPSFRGIQGDIIVLFL